MLASVYFAHDKRMIRAFFSSKSTHICEKFRFRRPSGSPLGALRGPPGPLRGANLASDLGEAYAYYVLEH